MKKLIALGDSHLRPFEMIRDFDIHVKVVMGATAQGAINRKSHTSSLEIFENTLRAWTKREKYDGIIVCLGEVDCGFSIWHYHIKYNIPLWKQTNRAIGNYNRFIDEVVLRYFEPYQVSLVQVVMPIVPPRHYAVGMVRKRNDISASIDSRIRLANIFNKKIERMVKQKGLNFININPIVAPDGIVIDQYKRNPGDHHYCSSATYKLYTEELKRIYIPS